MRLCLTLAVLRLPSCGPSSGTPVSQRGARGHRDNGSTVGASAGSSAPHTRRERSQHHWIARNSGPARPGAHAARTRVEGGQFLLMRRKVHRRAVVLRAKEGRPRRRSMQRVDEATDRIKGRVYVRAKEDLTVRRPPPTCRVRPYCHPGPPNDSRSSLCRGARRRAGSRRPCAP
jgi:hypothetical protein